MTTPTQSDAALRALEARAQELDRLDAAAADDAATAHADACRRELLADLEAAGLLAGTPEVRARLAELPVLRGYHDAVVALVRYLACAARRERGGTALPARIREAPVSLDWFRGAGGLPPEGLSSEQWLAACEAAARDPAPPTTGTRFVRVAGILHCLFFRQEAGPGGHLWRATPMEERRPGPEAAIARALPGLVAAVQALPPEGIAPVEWPFLIAGRRALLRVAPLPAAAQRGYLELQAWGASGPNHCAQWLASGSAAELVAWLQRPETVPDLLAVATELRRSIDRNEPA